MQSLAFVSDAAIPKSSGGGSSVTEFGVTQTLITFHGIQHHLGWTLSIVPHHKSQGLHPGWVDGRARDHSGSIACPTSPSGRFLFIYTCAYLVVHL